MSAFDLLQGWLRPLLDPLNEVRGVIKEPVSIHQETVSNFASLVAGLYEGSNAFEGDAANAVKATTESYLHLEAQFSGAGTAAAGTYAASAVLTVPTAAATDTVLEDAADSSVECCAAITDAIEVAAAKWGADAGLDAVTEAVDIVDIAQGGLDPVTDVPGIILTAIDAALKIAILVAFGWSIFNAVESWVNEMNRLGHITWPPLPSFLDPSSAMRGNSYPGLPMNVLTEGQRKLLKRLLTDYPEIDQATLEELIREGYTEDELRAIIAALIQNANNRGLHRYVNSAQWTQFMDTQLAAITSRYKNAQETGQYLQLLVAGYTDAEIRSLLFTNLISPTDLLARTELIRRSGLYNRLSSKGDLTDTEIRSLLRAGFTESNLEVLLQRIVEAQKYGTDSQGLTNQQIHDLLFREQTIYNGERFQPGKGAGIVTALLSGDEAKVREGQVARCALDQVTEFGTPFGPNGEDGEIDVVTNREIIEVKIDSVTGGVQRQIRDLLDDSFLNPGILKRVILYAPGYSGQGTRAIEAIGGSVVRSCKDLRDILREDGGL